MLSRFLFLKTKEVTNPYITSVLEKGQNTGYLFLMRQIAFAINLRGRHFSLMFPLYVPQNTFFLCCDWVLLSPELHKFTAISDWLHRKVARTQLG